MDALHLHDVPPLQQWRDQQREIQVRMLACIPILPDVQ
jgi:hypothetical protein